MSENLTDGWSPADNPYAIASSEASWWRATVALAVGRMHGNEDLTTAWLSSRQVDARTLINALRQLLTAVKLERGALTDLSMDQQSSTHLTRPSSGSWRRCQTSSTCAMA